MVSPYTTEIKASNWFLEIVYKSKPQMSNMPAFINKM